MHSKLRLFFLSSLGLVVLALVWVSLRTQTATSSYKSIATKPIDVTSITSIEVKSAKSSEKRKQPVPREIVTSTDKTSHSNKSEITSTHTYAEPSETVYLDQLVEHKSVVNYMDFISGMKFDPIEEPEFVGVNDQGFDQYEFQARDGSKVKQWRRSAEVSVEEITLDNGDKITRRAPENDVPVSTVAYEAKDANTYKSVNYRNDGTVQSIYLEENGAGITYYYDQQGRLTGMRSWEPAEKK